MNSILFVQLSNSFKRTILATMAIFFLANIHAQNVGIGTTNPLRKFSVAGSIAIDNANQNPGTLDSAALVFGTGGTGIISRKVGPGQINDLSLWTGNQQRLQIRNDGNVGIGGDGVLAYKLRLYGGDMYTDGSIILEDGLRVGQYAAVNGNVDPAFRLRVYNGDTRLGGDMNATGNAAIGGDVDPLYRLRVIGGDSRFGGDMHATGNVGFGGLPDNNFRLKVYNGNSYFDGNIQSAGTATLAAINASGSINTNSNVTAGGTITANNLNVNNTLTIGGNGSVRSNGNSPLRIGFDAKTVDVLILGSGATSVTANITSFTGDNDDVRVSVSQVKLNAGNTLLLDQMVINITSVDAATNTCILRIKNLSVVNVTLKATIYLMTVAKN